MPKISLLSILSALWLTIIGLMAVYAVAMFVFNSLFSNAPMSSLTVKVLAPNAILLTIFGVITCLAAAKQLRRRAPMWVLASLGLGAGYFLVHFISIYLILAPSTDIQAVADFTREIAWQQLVVGPPIIVALFALPLAYNLFMRRAPS